MEMRKWENEKMGKWENGKMGKWENGKMGKRDPYRTIIARQRSNCQKQPMFELPGYGEIA